MKTGGVFLRSRVRGAWRIWRYSETGKEEGEGSVFGHALLYIGEQGRVEVCGRVVGVVAPVVLSHPQALRDVSWGREVQAAGLVRALGLLDDPAQRALLLLGEQPGGAADLQLGLAEEEEREHELSCHAAYRRREGLSILLLRHQLAGDLAGKVRATCVEDGGLRAELVGRAVAQVGLLDPDSDRAESKLNVFGILGEEAGGVAIARASLAQLHALRVYVHAKFLEVVL
eukprot:766432-Hanusia_phi.AAC.1